MSEEAKKTEYAELDKNMIVETVFPDAEDAVLHSVREEVFDLYNFYEPRTSELFVRMPADTARAASEKVYRLSRETAGGRVRFTTDSKYLLLKAVEPSVGRNSHITLASSAGFDVYADTDSGSRFIGTFMPPYKMDHGYEQIVRFPDRKTRSFTVNFPVHSTVSELYFGIEPGAFLGHGRPYRDIAPIVVYGSSIVHGTAATRPGLVYTNILSRRLGADVVNLGFSGNAKAEPAMMEYVAGLEMSVFVYDYDHNAPNPDYLRATHLAGYRTVREKNPDLPIILVSKPNIYTRPQDGLVRRDIISDTFRAARAEGDRRIWFVDGESFFHGRLEDECTVEGVHPNDLGFVLMADGIEAVIRRALNAAGIGV
ncbi:MAG: hypothetical protein ILO42_08485 [Clostridia bacterium]|nr:hypothetical protein [Clostridia bacterium]MBP5270979.1 hypothetical protein [Clostridia bacterium]